MQRLIKTMVFFGVFIFSNTVALAQVTLTVSTWGSPQHGANVMVWPTWSRWVEEATNGRVKIKMVYELAPPNSQMEVVTAGTADITWLFHGFYPEYFTTTTLPEFPTFTTLSSEKLSVAYWRTFDKYLRKANEYRGLVVLGLGVHGPGSLLTKEKITNLSQLAGKRLRISGRLMSFIATELDIAGVAMPPTVIYEAATYDEIVGSLLTLETLKSFRLADVFPYVYQLPGGLYRGSFSLVINRDRWETLTPKDQAAIQQVSGEKLSALFGQMMDKYDKEGMAFAKAKGNQFTKADEKDITHLKKITADIPVYWVKDHAKKGFDSQAAIDFYRAQLAQ